MPESRRNESSGGYVWNVTPKPPEWLAERQAFWNAFKELMDEGVNAGFLGYSACYECGGEIEMSDTTEDWEVIAVPVRVNHSHHLPDHPGVVITKEG